METVVIQKSRWNERWLYLVGALAGCAFITLCARIKVPFYPVPFTLHTLAIFILAFTQTPKQVFGSVVCYLLCATAGFPVLHGASNPLWIMGPTGGYLVAFPIAAYVTSKLSQRISPFLAFFVGEAIILGLGMVWLLFMIGPKLAWVQGALLFIPSDLLKGMVAIGIAKGWKRIAPC